MNFIAVLSLTLLASTPMLQGADQQYQREREAKRASQTRNLEAEVKAVAAQPVIVGKETTEIQPPKYPKTQLRLKDLQAKIERLGREALSPKEREALIAQGKDLESEIRKAGLKKLSDEERELYDLLLFGGLAETYGEAQGIQGMICEYLTGWHEVGQFKGHQGAITAIDRDQDLLDKRKDILISGGQDGTVKIWDIDTQTCKYTLPADEHPVTALAMTVTVPRTLAVAYGSYIKLFTMQKGKTPTLTKIFTGFPSSIVHLSSHYASIDSHDARLSADSAGGQFFRVWDIKTGKITFQGFGHSPDHRPWEARELNMFTFNPATNITQSTAVPEHIATIFSNTVSLSYNQKYQPSHHLFASGDAQGNIYIWDTTNPSCITKLEGHTAKITGLLMNYKYVDIKKLRPPKLPCSCPCSGCKSTYKEEKPGHFVILSWEEHCKSCREQYEKASQESPDTIQLISASEDGTIRLWEMSEGTKKLPALITQAKEVAENPGYLSEDEEDCDCDCCNYDSDSEDEDEKESAAALRRRIKEDQGS